MRYLTDQQRRKGLWLEPTGSRLAAGRPYQSTASFTVYHILLFRRIFLHFYYTRAAACCRRFSPHRTVRRGDCYLSDRGNFRRAPSRLVGLRDCPLSYTNRDKGTGHCLAVRDSPQPTLPLRDRDPSPLSLSKNPRSNASGILLFQ